ncbi:MAG TPA: hypothetical protein VNU47_00100 [Candidatus Paceibacterota bacterium]|nr:hypothetical protein [Candidatus Paceibacterota bacterium]
MKRFFTQSVTFLVALSLVGSTFTPLLERYTPRAQAQVATLEGPGPLLAAAVETAFVETAEQTEDITMRILEAIALAVARAAIQSMTHSIVTWINSGFDGSPAFVTDLNISMRNLADGVARDFFANLELEGMNVSPFLERVVTGVGAAYYLNSSEERLQRRLRYTLRQYAPNDRAFLDGDFEEGGFNAWFSVWLHQANNPIGAHYIAGTELANRIEAESFERLEDFRNGRGFISWRGECKAYSDPVPSLGKEEKCLQYEVKTPGSVIEQQLIHNQQSPLRQLELADSIDSIVGALAMQLVTQVLGGTGLIGASRPSTNGGASPLARATDPNRTAGNTTSMRSGFAQNVRKEQANATAYVTAWQRIQGAATTAQAGLASGVCADKEQKQALVGATLAEAANAIKRGQDAVAALTNILSGIPEGEDPSTSVLSTASNDYMALLSGGTLPSATEVARAKTESGSGTGTLYTQMMDIAKECGT